MILVGISDFWVAFEASRLRVSLIISSRETGSNENDAQEVRTDGVDLTSNKKFKSLQDINHKKKLYVIEPILDFRDEFQHKMILNFSDLILS